MGNKLRHEGDEVRIKVIWTDIWVCLEISHSKIHWLIMCFPNKNATTWGHTPCPDLFRHAQIDCWIAYPMKIQLQYPININRIYTIDIPLIFPCV